MSSASPPPNSTPIGASPHTSSGSPTREGVSTRHSSRGSAAMADTAGGEASAASGGGRDLRHKLKDEKKEEASASTPVTSGGKKRKQPHSTSEGDLSSGSLSGTEREAKKKRNSASYSDADAEDVNSSEEGGNGAGGAEEVALPRSAWFPSDVVWAKYPGYPFWPGMVIDERTMAGPLPRRPPHTHLVFFFAENNWSWVKESCLLPYADRRLNAVYAEFRKSKKARSVAKLFEQANEIADRKWMEQIDRLEDDVAFMEKNPTRVRCNKCQKVQRALTTASRKGERGYLRCHDCQMCVCTKCHNNSSFATNFATEGGEGAEKVWTCGRCYVFHWRRMKDFLEKVKAVDKKKSFWRPVDTKAVPDYTDVVERPMDFMSISKSLNDFEYATPEDMRADISLICNNAMSYNADNTRYYAEAEELLKYLNEVFPVFFEKTPFAAEIFPCRYLPPLSIPALESSLKGGSGAAASGDPTTSNSSPPSPTSAPPSVSTSPTNPSQPTKKPPKRERKKQTRQSNSTPSSPQLHRSPSPGPNGDDPMHTDDDLHHNNHYSNGDAYPSTRSSRGTRSNGNSRHSSPEREAPRHNREREFQEPKGAKGWQVDVMNKLKKFQEKVLKLREHKLHIQQLIEENDELRREISNKNNNVSMLVDTLEQKNQELLDSQRLVDQKDRQLQELQSELALLRQEKDHLQLQLQRQPQQPFQSTSTSTFTHPEPPRPVLPSPAVPPPPPSITTLDPTVAAVLGSTPAPTSAPPLSSASTSS